MRYLNFFTILFVIFQLLAKPVEDRLGCGLAGAAEVVSNTVFSGINFKRLEAGKLNPPFVPDVCLFFCFFIYPS